MKRGHARIRCAQHHIGANGVRFGATCPMKRRADDIGTVIASFVAIDRQAGGHVTRNTRYAHESWRSKAWAHGFCLRRCLACRRAHGKRRRHDRSRRAPLGQYRCGHARRLRAFGRRFGLQPSERAPVCQRADPREGQVHLQHGVRKLRLRPGRRRPGRCRGGHRRARRHRAVRVQPRVQPLDRSHADARRPDRVERTVLRPVLEPIHSAAAAIGSARPGRPLGTGRRRRRLGDLGQAPVFGGPLRRCRRRSQPGRQQPLRGAGRLQFLRAGSQPRLLHEQHVLRGRR